MEMPDGSEVMVREPEAIHTFAGWKALGYSVKKGEHAVAQFPIWSGKEKVVTDDDGNETTKTNLFMRKAFWFTAGQVEKADPNRRPKRTRRVTAPELVPDLPAVVPMVDAAPARYGSWLAEA